MKSKQMSENTDSTAELKIVPISELKLGMVVHSIAQQSGNLSVKSKGSISHLGIIEQLRVSGVRSVIVECKAILSKVSEPITSSERSKQTPKRNTHTLKPKQNTSTAAQSNGSLAFSAAESLINKSQDIFQKLREDLAKNSEVDLSDCLALCAQVYSTVAENPNALLCLNMIMQSNDYMAKQSIHVATLICYFAHYLGCSKNECESLAVVGYLYDVGMVKIPPEIRLNENDLSKEEQEQIKLHVSHSMALLAPLKMKSEYNLAIEQHHERLDGSGYPYGYEGIKIHKFSRILAIVDTYDALTSPRTHTAPLLPAAAMKVLCITDNGYDQKLVLKFIRCMGVYPVGSLVALSNKHVGIVIKTNKGAPISPVVKVFYNLVGDHFVSPQIIDLLPPSVDSDPSAHAFHENTPIERSTLRVTKPVLASQFDLDLMQVLED